MQKNKKDNFHLIYVRFAFPVLHEPGPKRPIEIIERYHLKGHRITVITSGGNYMTGNIPPSGFKTKNGCGFVKIEVGIILNV